MSAVLDQFVATPNSGRLNFNGVKVFSATMMAQRDALGALVTDWILTNQHLEVVDIVVSQSSDASFHCIAITVFYFELSGTRASESEGHAARRVR